MDRFAFGDILLVDFPFSDGSGSKRRPALVIAHDLEDDLLLARITSKPRESPTDARILDWKLSNLLFPSTVRLAKLATLSLTLIEKKIRQLTIMDKTETLAALHAFADSLGV